MQSSAEKRSHEEKPVTGLEKPIMCWLFHKWIELGETIEPPVDRGPVVVQWRKCARCGIVRGLRGD
jgi:hypothetical protein